MPFFIINQIYLIQKKKKLGDAYKSGRSFSMSKGVVWESVQRDIVEDDSYLLDAIDIE